jgi:hypothetical protein
MGFTVENKESNKQYALVKFVFYEPFTSDDMTKVLAILTNLLDLKKPFAFYVDTRTANNPPVNAASSLLQWMKTNKHRFEKQLICTSVVFGNTMTNNLVSKLLNGVFMIQPPVSPNKLTNNLALAEKWIDERIMDFKNHRHIITN